MDEIEESAQPSSTESTKKKTKKKEDEDYLVKASFEGRMDTVDESLKGVEWVFVHSALRNRSRVERM